MGFGEYWQQPNKRRFNLNAGQKQYNLDKLSEEMGISKKQLQSIFRKNDVNKNGLIDSLDSLSGNELESFLTDVNAEFTTIDTSKKTRTIEYKDVDENEITEVYNNSNELVEKTIVTTSDVIPPGAVQTTEQSTRYEKQRVITLKNGKISTIVYKLENDKNITVQFEYINETKDNTPHVVIKTYDDKNTVISEYKAKAVDKDYILEHNDKFDENLFKDEDFIELKTTNQDGNVVIVKREEFKTKEGTIQLISETKKLNDKESITTVYGTDSFYFYEILKGEESKKAMVVYQNGENIYSVQYDKNNNTITHAANGDSLNSLIKKFGFKDENEFYQLNPKLKGKVIKVGDQITVPGRRDVRSPEILAQGTAYGEIYEYASEERLRNLEKFRSENLSKIPKDIFDRLNTIEGFELNNENSEMYFKINSYDKDVQESVLKYIQKLTKEGKTPEEIKEAFLYNNDAPQLVLEDRSKMRINLFDGYLISLAGFKGKPLSKDMSVKHFVTEELGLDINKDEGKELYTKLLSIKKSDALQDLIEMFSAIKLRTTPEYASYHLSEISMCNKSDAYEKYNTRNSGRHTSSYNNNQAYKQTLLDNKPIDNNTAKDMYIAVINKLSAKNPEEVKTKYDAFIKDHMHSKERTFVAMMLSQMLLDEDMQLKEFSASKSILNPIGKAASTIARYSTGYNWKKAKEVEKGLFLGNKRTDLLLRLSNPDDGVKFDVAKVRKLMSIQETISKKNKPLYDKISNLEKEYEKATDKKRKEEIKKEIGDIYKTLSESEPYKSLNKQYQEALTNVFGKELVDGFKDFLSVLDFIDGGVDMAMMLLGTHAIGKLIAKCALFCIPRTIQLSSTAATAITGTASTMQKVGNIAFPILSSLITFPLWDGIKYTTDYYTNDIDETKMGEASYTYSEGLTSTVKHSIPFAIFAGAWGQLTGYGLRLLFKTPAGEKIMEKSCEYLSKECASSGGFTSAEIRAGMNKVRESMAKNWKKTTASFGGEVLGFSMYEIASNIASGMYTIDENGNLYRTEKTANGVEFQSEMSYLDVGWEQCKTLLSFKALGQILFMRRHEGGMNFGAKMPKEQELQIKPITKDGKTTYEVQYPDGTIRKVPDMHSVISLSNMHYEDVTLYKPLAEILEKKGKMELRDGIVITKEGEEFKISLKDGSEFKSNDLRSVMGQAQGEYLNRSYEKELREKGQIELPNKQVVTFDKETNTYKTTIEDGIEVEASSFRELMQAVQKKRFCINIEKSFTEDKKVIMLDLFTVIRKTDDGEYSLLTLKGGYAKEYKGKSVEDLMDLVAADKAKEQQYADAHRIENNISEESRQKVEDIKEQLPETVDEEKNGVFRNEDAEFTIENGKIVKIVTKDGREITDEKKIAKYEYKYGIDISKLEEVKAEVADINGKKNESVQEEQTQSQAEGIAAALPFPVTGRVLKLLTGNDGKTSPQKAQETEEKQPERVIYNGDKYNPLSIPEGADFVEKDVEPNDKNAPKGAVKVIERTLSEFFTNRHQYYYLDSEGRCLRENTSQFGITDYEYNEQGMLLTKTQGETQSKYIYDKDGKTLLHREDYYNNVLLRKVYEYESNKFLSEHYNYRKDGSLSYIYITKDTAPYKVRRFDTDGKFLVEYDAVIRAKDNPYEITESDQKGIDEKVAQGMDKSLATVLVKSNAAKQMDSNLLMNLINASKTHITNISAIDIAKFLDNNPNVNISELTSYINNQNMNELYKLAPSLETAKPENLLEFFKYHFEHNHSPIYSAQLQINNLGDYLSENYANTNELEKLLTIFPNTNKNVGRIPDGWMEHNNPRAINQIFEAIDNFRSRVEDPDINQVKTGKKPVYDIESAINRIGYSIDKYKNNRAIKKLEKDLSNALNKEVTVTLLSDGSFSTAYKISVEGAKDVVLKIYHKDEQLEDIFKNSDGKYIEVQNGLYLNKHSDKFARFHFGRVSTENDPNGFVVAEFLEGTKTDWENDNLSNDPHVLIFADDTTQGKNTIGGKSFDFGRVAIIPQDLHEPWQELVPQLKDKATEENIIGQGAEAKVFALDKNYVMRVNGNETVTDNMQMTHVQDIFEGRNFGQTVARDNLGNITINRRVPGKHIYEINQTDIPKYLETLRKFAELSDETLEQFVNDVAFINSKGYRIDQTNPENFLYDEETGKIGILDLARKNTASFDLHDPYSHSWILDPLINGHDLIENYEHMTPSERRAMFELISKIEERILPLCEKYGIPVAKWNTKDYQPDDLATVLALRDNIDYESSLLIQCNGRYPKYTESIITYIDNMIKEANSSHDFRVVRESINGLSESPRKNELIKEYESVYEKFVSENGKIEEDNLSPLKQNNTNNSTQKPQFGLDGAEPQASSTVSNNAASAKKSRSFVRNLRGRVEKFTGKIGGKSKNKKIDTDFKFLPNELTEQQLSELKELLIKAGYKESYYNTILINNKAGLPLIYKLAKENKLSSISEQILNNITPENIDIYNRLLDYNLPHWYGNKPMDDWSIGWFLSTVNNNSTSSENCLARKRIINNLIDKKVIKNNRDICELFNCLNNITPENVEYVEYLITEKTEIFSNILKDWQHQSYFNQSLKYITKQNEKLLREYLNTSNGKNLELLEDISKLTSSSISQIFGSEKLHLAEVIDSLDSNTLNLLKKYEYNLPKIKELLLATLPSVQVSKEKQNNFLKNIIANNNSQSFMLLQKFDFSQFGKNGIPLKYPREDFMRNVRNILKDLSESEQTLILNHFGINSNFDGFLNNKPYESKSPKTQKIADMVLREIEKYTVENETTIDNPEMKQVLDALIQGCPEFTASIGKIQHEGHDYSLDIHMLKVFQSVINDPLYETLSDSAKTIVKFSALLHDIGKPNGIDDQTHSITSSEYMFSLLEKFNLSFDIKQRILDTIYNHHWFSRYNTDNMSPNEAAAKMRRPEDFEIYKILAKADFSNINSCLHLELTGCKTQAEFDKYFDKKTAPIREALNILHQTAPFAFSTPLLNNGENFPKLTVKKNDKEYQVNVLNLNELKPGESLEKYGFAPGTTKDNLIIDAHMTLDLESTYNLLTTNERLHTGHPALSSSMNRVGSENGLVTYYGFALTGDNSSLVTVSDRNLGSGEKKNLMSVTEGFFGKKIDDLEINRTMVRDEFIKNLYEQTGIKISIEEYGRFHEQVLSKIKYLSQLSDYNLTIGGNKIEVADLLAVIEKTNNRIFDVIDNQITDGYIANTEVVRVDVTIKCLVGRYDVIDECPPEFIEFAEKHNLGIILMSPQKYESDKTQPTTGNINARTNTNTTLIPEQPVSPAVEKVEEGNDIVNASHLNIIKKYSQRGKSSETSNRLKDLVLKAENPETPADDDALLVEHIKLCDRLSVAENREEYNNLINQINDSLEKIIMSNVNEADLTILMEYFQTIESNTNYDIATSTAEENNNLNLGTDYNQLDSNVKGRLNELKAKAQNPEIPTDEDAQLIEYIKLCDGLASVKTLAEENKLINRLNDLMQKIAENGISETDLYAISDYYQTAVSEVDNRLRKSSSNGADVNDRVEKQQAGLNETEKAKTETNQSQAIKEDITVIIDKMNNVESEAELNALRDNMIKSQKYTKEEQNIFFKHYPAQQKRILLRNLIDNDLEYENVLRVCVNEDGSLNPKNLQQKIDFLNCKKRIEKLKYVKDCEELESEINSINLMKDDLSVIKKMLTQKTRQLQQMVNEKNKIKIQSLNHNGTVNQEKYLENLEKYFDEINTKKLQQVLSNVRTKADCDYLEAKVRQVPIKSMSVRERSILLRMIKEKRRSIVDDNESTYISDLVLADLSAYMSNPFGHVEINFEKYPVTNFLYDAMTETIEKCEESEKNVNIFGVGENSLRGRNIVTLPEYVFEDAKANGLLYIIDLREAEEGRLFDTKTIKVRDGKKFIDEVEYFEFPVNHDPSNNKECDFKTIKNLGRFFTIMNTGSYYIGCSNGLHRTDFALGLNYVLNTKTSASDIPEFRDSYVKDIRQAVSRIYNLINELKATKTQAELNEYGLDTEILSILPRPSQILMKSEKVC